MPKEKPPEPEISEESKKALQAGWDRAVAAGDVGLEKPEAAEKKAEKKVEKAESKEKKDFFDKVLSFTRGIGEKWQNFKNREVPLENLQQRYDAALTPEEQAADETLMKQAEAEKAAIEQKFAAMTAEEHGEASLDESLTRGELELEEETLSKEYERLAQEVAQEGEEESKLYKKVLAGKAEMPPPSEAGAKLNETYRRLMEVRLEREKLDKEATARKAYEATAKKTEPAAAEMPQESVESYEASGKEDESLRKMFGTSPEALKAIDYYKASAGPHPEYGAVKNRGISGKGTVNIEYADGTKVERTVDGRVLTERPDGSYSTRYEQPKVFELPGKSGQEPMTGMAERGDKRMAAEDEAAAEASRKGERLKAFYEKMLGSAADLEARIAAAKDETEKKALNKELGFVRREIERTRKQMGAAEAVVPEATAPEAAVAAATGAAAGLAEAELKASEEREKQRAEKNDRAEALMTGVRKQFPKAWKSIKTFVSEMLSENPKALEELKSMQKAAEDLAGNEDGLLKAVQAFELGKPEDMAKLKGTPAMRELNDLYVKLHADAVKYAETLEVKKQKPAVKDKKALKPRSRKPKPPAAEASP